ncbi:MAG: hypothetical protein P8X79_12170 [Reinekea sp.]
MACALRRYGVTDSGISTKINHLMDLGLNSTFSNGRILSESALKNCPDRFSSVSFIEVR